MDTNMALKTWELQNDVKTLESADELYVFDLDEQTKILNEKPWARDPCYFKEVKISALALLKMVIHARSGKSLEIMGLLLGKVVNAHMIVMDTFALPVEGTETQVNAQAQAYEYMTQYIEMAREVGRLENAIGWYHSHPGYGCWLSGIDVATQSLNQTYQDPFLAIVIDPIRTVSAGKVCLGAFRTFPKNFMSYSYKAGPAKGHNIPSDKIIDFGVHNSKYYSLDVSYFKSALDARLLKSMWAQFWINTLSTSPLLTNLEYLTKPILDNAQKLEDCAKSLNTSKNLLGASGSDSANDEVDMVSKVVKDCCQVPIDCLKGLMPLIVQNKLFNQPKQVADEIEMKCDTAANGDNVK